MRVKGTIDILLVGENSVWKQIIENALTTEGTVSSATKLSPGLISRASVLVVMGDDQLWNAVQDYKGTFQLPTYYVVLSNCDLKLSRSDVLVLNNGQAPILSVVAKLRKLVRSKLKPVEKKICVVYDPERYPNLWDKLVAIPGVTEVYQALTPDLDADTIIVLSGAGSDLANDVDSYKGRAMIIFARLIADVFPKRVNIQRIVIRREHVVEDVQRLVKLS